MRLAKVNFPRNFVNNFIIFLIIYNTNLWPKIIISLQFVRLAPRSRLILVILIALADINIICIKVKYFCIFCCGCATTAFIHREAAQNRIFAALPQKKYRENCILTQLYHFVKTDLYSWKEELGSRIRPHSHSSAIFRSEKS